MDWIQSPLKETELPSINYTILRAILKIGARAYNDDVGRVGMAFRWSLECCQSVACIYGQLPLLDGSTKQQGGLRPASQVGALQGAWI